MRNFEIRNIIHIFIMELKVRRKTIFFWMIGLLALTLLYMGLFKEVASMMGEELNNLPPELLSIFGGNVDLTNYNHYFGMVYKIISLVIGAYVLILIASSIHDEVNKGTGEYLYSQNVSRNEVLVSKIIMSIIIFIGLHLVVCLTAVIVGASINESTFSGGTIFKITLLTSIPSLAFVGIGVLVSSLLKKNMKAIGIGLGVFFGLYLIGYISTLGGDKLTFFKWFSPLEYVLYKDVINNTKSIWIGDVLGLVIAIASSVGGILIYNKKDL